MKTSVLRVVEAAYAPGNDEQWLTGIADAALPALNLGRGVGAYTYHVPPTPSAKPVIDVYVQRGSEHLSRELAEALIRDSPVQLARDVYTLLGVSTISEFLGVARQPAPFVRSHFSTVALQDALGIVSINPGGRGIVVSTGLPEATRIPDVFKRLWTRVSLHLSAGLRLRSTPSGALPPIEAVLDADGKVHDASGPARDREARAALRVAARAIDRARSSRETAPEPALALWRGLVEGRWSLLDQFESDGRRYLVARPNTVQAAPLRRLSPAERQVTALAALGRTNKLIAYELGVSVGTVGTLLSRAMSKLGLSSRVQLIETWRRAGADEAPPALEEQAR